MLGRIKKILKSRYVLGAYLQRRYERRFLSETNSNLFYGLYKSFDEAATGLPNTKPSGYDNEASAEKYKNLCLDIRDEDYPVLYWLSKVSSERDKVLEIGGHIGVSFYSFDGFSPLSSGIDWTIYDVEAVTVKGAELAKEKGETRLKFNHDLSQVDKDINIVFAFGSLQYIKESLVDLMESAEIKPVHIMVNLQPVTEKQDYYTVNNIGTAFCPYKIMNRDKFVSLLNCAGYELVDEWRNPNKRCIIPFENPTYSLHSYKGFYFRKKS